MLNFARKTILGREFARFGSKTNVVGLEPAQFVRKTQKGAGTYSICKENPKKRRELAQFVRGKKLSRKLAKFVRKKPNLRSETCEFCEEKFDLRWETCSICEEETSLSGSKFVRKNLSCLISEENPT